MTDEFPDMPSKVCSMCKAPKKIMHFHADKSQKDGLRRWCMQCVREQSENKRVRNAVPASIGERFNDVPFSTGGFEGNRA